jgi:hypothetical protein
VTDPFEPPSITRERAEGLLTELAEDRYGAEPFGPSGPAWADAEGPAGNPIELKACALRIRDGASRRRGRWLIRRRSHETLLRERGRYVFGVYDSAPEIVAVANVPAERVEQLLGGASWWECESSEQGGDATQLAFTELFPALDQQIVAPAREETPIVDTLEGSSP